MLSVKQRGAVVCWYNTLSFDLSKAILWHSRLDTGGLRPYDADNCWFDGRRRMLDDYCFGADWWFVAKGRSNSNTRLAFSGWFGLSKCCIRLWNFLFWRIAALSRASTGRLALFWGAYRSKWWRHHHTMCWRGWCRPRVKGKHWSEAWNSSLSSFPEGLFCQLALTHRINAPKRALSGFILWTGNFDEVTVKREIMPYRILQENTVQMWNGMTKEHGMKHKGTLLKRKRIKCKAFHGGNLINTILWRYMHKYVKIYA